MSKETNKVRNMQQARKRQKQNEKDFKLRV